MFRAITDAVDAVFLTKEERVLKNDVRLALTNFKQAKKDVKAAEKAMNNASCVCTDARLEGYDSKEAIADLRAEYDNFKDIYHQKQIKLSNASNRLAASRKELQTYRDIARMH